MDGNQLREYVFTNDTWVLLGYTASAIYNSDSITAESEDVPTWISKITQATDGSIQIERKTIGALPIAHGGTGVTVFTPNQIILSTNPGENETMTFTSRAYLNSTSAEALGTSTNFVTEQDIYYGLPQINHNHNYNSETDLYVPLNSGNNGQILISSGSNNEPIWSIAAILNSDSESIADTAAYTTLTLGNNTDISSAAHYEGRIKLYSAATNAHIITGMSTTNDYIHTLPNGDGVLVQTASGGTVGGSTQPVYINDNVITAITYTPNRLYCSGNETNQIEHTASSFIPTNHYANENQIGLGITALPNGNTDTLYVNGTTGLNGNATITGNLIPSSTNTYTLGIGAGNTEPPTNPFRWQKLYIGTADSYGDDDNDANHNIVPIYWNDGVPTPLSSSVGDAYTPVYLNGGSITKVTPIQYCGFTIGSGKTGVRLSHAAFTGDSYVLQIVITSGESNLNSAINWGSFAGYIELTCATTSNKVNGYILVSRGGALSDVTLADLPLTET